MTIGFGLASTLLLLGFAVLVFVLLAAAAKVSGDKLNPSDMEAADNETGGGFDIGTNGSGIYLDDDSAWPVHKIN